MSSIGPQQERLTRRAFLRRVLAAGTGLGLAGASCGTYAWLLEPGWVQIDHVAVPLPRLPRMLNGFTIAHLSDLHVGPFLGPAALASAVEMVQSLSPQAVVITGDFVTRGSEWQQEQALAPLAALRAPSGVFAVLGNHDHWTDPAWITAAVRRLGISLLHNSALQLSDSGQGLWMVGVDDIWVGAGDLTAALARVPEDACQLLLVHEPDFADKAARTGIDLQLSGHSHGGQVRLPLLGAPLLPLWGRRYPIGLQSVGASWVYTNRGLGVVDPPLRFNCRPEITLLTLTRPA